MAKPQPGGKFILLLIIIIEQTKSEIEAVTQISELTLWKQNDQESNRLT